MLKYLENESFNEIINQDKVLVDFYAEWCGPCKMLTPVLERLGESFEIVKVDVDKHFDLAKEYGIMSVPTLFIFLEVLNCLLYNFIKILRDVYEKDIYKY